MQNSETKMALAGLVAVAVLGGLGAYELAGASEGAQPTTASSAGPSSTGAQQPGNAQVGGSNHTVYNNTHSTSSSSTGPSGSGSSSSGSSPASGGASSGPGFGPVITYWPLNVHPQNNCHLPAKPGDYATAYLEWWTEGANSVELQFNGQTIATFPSTPSISTYGHFTTGPSAALCSEAHFVLVAHGGGKTVSKVLTYPAPYDKIVDGPVQSHIPAATACVLHPQAPGCAKTPVPAH